MVQIGPHEWMIVQSGPQEGLAKEEEQLEETFRIRPWGERAREDGESEEIVLSGPRGELATEEIWRLMLGHRRGERHRRRRTGGRR